MKRWNRRFRRARGEKDRYEECYFSAIAALGALRFYLSVSLTIGTDT